jgi:hypothetical protein
LWIQPYRLIAWIENVNSTKVIKRLINTGGTDTGTRESLLDAAVALFAEQGVAATSSAKIAARAGVTPAMVHYHFRCRLIYSCI